MSLITLGETMGLVVQAGSGHVANGEPMTFRMGGAESNVAIGVRRLGMPVTWVGRLGDDPPGRLIRRELRAEQVEVIGIEDPAPTGLMTRWRPTADRSRVVYHRRDSAGSHLCPEDVPEAAVRAASVLHVTGITLALGAGPAAAVRRAIAVAREAGTVVSLDVNYRRALWSQAEAASTIGPLLPDCDVVFAGLEEAEILTGAEDPAAAVRQLAATGPRQAVVTLGAAGCAAHIDGADHLVAAPVVTVVDTVGAGDAFVAGYLAELIEGAAPAQRLATAVTAGALAVASPGDWEGMPDRAALGLHASAEPVVR